MEKHRRERAEFLIEGLEHCCKAIQAFSAAIDADPSYLPAYEARAWVYRASGHHQPALADLERIQACLVAKSNVCLQLPKRHF